MNKEFERLKALTRLANNNPNENEANLAARRVCKILEEKQFVFIEVRESSTAANKVYNVSNPVGNSGDWIRNKYTDPSSPTFDKSSVIFDEDVYDDIFNILKKCGFGPDSEK